MEHRTEEHIAGAVFVKGFMHGLRVRGLGKLCVAVLPKLRTAGLDKAILSNELQILTLKEYEAFAIP